MREMGDHIRDGSVEFRSLDNGDHFSDHADPGLWAVRTDYEWRWWWKLLHANQHPLPAVPPLEWTTEMVLVLALGFRRTSGYAVVIDRLVAGDDVLEVHARERRPGPTCVVGEAHTFPCQVVATAARDGELRLILRIETIDC
jgi:hypothetical protein